MPATGKIQIPVAETERIAKDLGKILESKIMQCKRAHNILYMYLRAPRHTV